MSNIIKTTGQYSLGVQIFTEIIMIIAYSYVWNINKNSYINILKELLIAELFVQFVEAIFYAWMIFNISNVTNITIFRYKDWMITTPTMLITLIFYLIFLKETNTKSEEPERFEENKPIIKNKTYFDMLYENLNDVVTIVLLNLTMLSFGYAGEIKLLSPVVSTFFGFIPFFIMFYIIYYKYAIYTNIGKSIFWYFSVIWALYGIAALMDYTTKNVMYNILDLFAKNFFGIFLSYKIISILTP